MLTISPYHDMKSLESKITKSALVDFLHANLDRFRDTPTAIAKAIDYAFSTEPGKGGFILLAWDDAILAGALVMNNTGMNEFIPPHILVYIAVNQELRGKGIGTMLIQKATELCDEGIALHVEYDNPAKKLYERLGFTSKYAEMRWERR